MSDKSETYWSTTIVSVGELRRVLADIPADTPVIIDDCSSVTVCKSWDISVGEAIDLIPDDSGTT